MTTPHRPRFVRALAALAATCALMVVTATPASADPVDSDTLVFVPYNGQTFTIWRNGNTSTPAYFTTAKAFNGNFDGNPGTDLFLYNPGGGADGVLHITPSGSNFTTSFRSETVNGSYQVVIGDYDGNAIDDILFYAPGSGADSIWLFQSNGTHTTKSVSISGTYKPLAINTDGDGYTDIIWYAPRAAADSIWLFGPGANHTNKSLSISGNYTLIPGYFGVQAEGSPQRRVIFFNKSGADYIWKFDTSANHTSVGMPNIDGDFRPVVGSFMDQETEAVLFYRPGTASERFISFEANGALNQLEPPIVNGTYDTTVGDFDGNGFSDIAFSGGGKATLWKFNGGGFTQQMITTTTVNTTTAAVKSFLFPA